MTLKTLRTLIAVGTGKLMLLLLNGAQPEETNHLCSVALVCSVAHQGTSPREGRREEERRRYACPLKDDNLTRESKLKHRRQTLDLSLTTAREKTLQPVLICMCSHVEHRPLSLSAFSSNLR